MLTAALSVRGWRGWLAPGRIRRIGAIAGPGSGTTPGSAAARRGTGAQPGTPAPGEDAPAPGGNAWRVVGDSPGQVPGSKLMALIVTRDRMIAPATLRFPPSAGLTELAAATFADLSASDDTGASYRVNFTDGGWAGSTWTGTILFRPPPAPGARLLTVNGPNGPVLRARLDPVAAAGQPVASAQPLADTPGERLLIRRAEALLGALASPDSPGHHRYPDAPTARRVAVAQLKWSTNLGFPGTTPPSTVTPATGPVPAAVFSSGPGERKADLAEVIEILEGARILSPLSPVPGRLAALSAALDPAGRAERGGGLAARRAESLPARWRAVLAYYGRRGHRPVASGTGSIGATLPEVDGARFAVAGVHSGRAGTTLHIVGHLLDPRPLPLPAPWPGHDMRFSWWVRDENGSWHLGMMQGLNQLPHGDLTMRLALLPPLRPGEPGSTGALTLEVSGTTGWLTADLTVRW